MPVYLVTGIPDPQTPPAEMRPYCNLEQLVPERNLVNVGQVPRATSYMFVRHIPGAPPCGTEWGDAPGDLCHDVEGQFMYSVSHSLVAAGTCSVL